MKYTTAYFVSFLSLVGTLMAISTTDFGNVFAILPPSSEWEKLVKDMKPCEIKKAVKAYIQPYREFQEAARDYRIGNDKLKAAMGMALRLLLDSSKNLSVMANEFLDLKASINETDVPLSRFILTKAKVKKLNDIFDSDSLQGFSEIRLRHMTRRDGGYLSFLLNKSKYENRLQEWIVIAERLPACKFRNLISRNIDLDYVEHMVAVYLDVMRLQAKAKNKRKYLYKIWKAATGQKSDLQTKIEALGNGYSVSKPPYSLFMIFVTTLYALLVTVMI